MYYTRFRTALCEITLVGDENGLLLTYLHTEDSKKEELLIQKEWVANKLFFSSIVEQIKEFLEGKRKRFDVELNLQGTEFQQKVWNALCDIPYGETRNYKEIAEAIGNPKASRAVGMANSKNPLTLIVPCHRVISANGKLVGFASGLKTKEKLLRLEGCIV